MESTREMDGTAQPTARRSPGASQDRNARLLAAYRDLHRHPELAMQEHRTAGIVAGRLAAAGFTVRTGLGGTGVAGEMRGSTAGPTLLLRADMDALPIQEETGLPYASDVAGVMHACGHDGHVTVLLEVAERLAATRSGWTGTVRCLFQPAEETAEGARACIADGVLEGVDRALALHLWTPLPAGTVGVLDGPVMAGSTDFRIVLRGRGGHAAEPHRAADPVVAAAQLVIALQTLVSRETDPLEGAVLTVGRVEAGRARNAIPESAFLEGTLRAFDPAVLAGLEAGVRRTAAGIAAASGVQAEVELIPDTVPTVNDPHVAARVREAARGVVGEDALRSDAGLRTTAAEDFGYVLERVPGCFLLVGAGGSEAGASPPHHSPRFRLAESALPIAADVLEAAALALLAGQAEISSRPSPPAPTAP
jgi:amidohydrolase